MAPIVSFFTAIELFWIGKETGNGKEKRIISIWYCGDSFTHLPTPVHKIMETVGNKMLQTRAFSCEHFFDYKLMEIYQSYHEIPLTEM